MFFFFQAEDGIRDYKVTGVQTCALPISWEGAEVIVPNASLVSERLTNWTYSDRLRRMDLPVGVAYGSAPEKVLELLLAVAPAPPGVLAPPAPQALFMGLPESGLNFEPRASTGRSNTS